MAKKNYTLVDIEPVLRKYLQKKGLGYWYTPEGLAVIDKAVTRHKAIEALQTSMMTAIASGKGWDEEWHEHEFAKILSAYPVCTYSDHTALSELAVVISDLERAQLHSFVGRMTQRQRAATATLEDQNKKLEERYLGYIKDHPKATIQVFINWYSKPKNHPDKIQTNNLYERIKTIRKNNGLAKKSPAKK